MLNKLMLLKVVQTNFRFSSTKVWDFKKTYDLDKYPKIYPKLEGIIGSFGGEKAEFYTDYIDSAVSIYKFPNEKKAEIFICEFPGDLHFSANDKTLFEKIIEKLEKELTLNKKE